MKSSRARGEGPSDNCSTACSAGAHRSVAGGWNGGRGGGVTGEAGGAKRREGWSK